MRERRDARRAAAERSKARGATREADAAGGGTHFMLSTLCFIFYALRVILYNIYSPRGRCCRSRRHRICCTTQYYYDAALYTVYYILYTALRYTMLHYARCPGERRTLCKAHTLYIVYSIKYIVYSIKHKV